MKIEQELADIAELLEQLTRCLELYVNRGDRKAALFRDSVVRRLDEVRGLLGANLGEEAVMLFLLDPLPNPVDFDAVGLDLARYGEAAGLCEQIEDHAAAAARLF